MIIHPPFIPYPVSALYRLQFWLDPFDVYTSYEATAEGVSHLQFLAKFDFFGNFLKFVTLTMSSFDLGSNVNH